MKQPSLRVYMYLSIAAALVTMGVKFIGYFLTGSVGLFSDAAESVVNVVAALVGLWAVTLAARPADEEHTYGHTKSEYFSSGVEGALILVAALIIAVAALPRLLHPEPIKQAFLGLAFSVSGAVINGVLAWFMLREGKKQRSITLEADAHHLFTDVMTTAGVLCLSMSLCQEHGQSSKVIRSVKKLTWLFVQFCQIAPSSLILNQRKTL